MLTLGRQPDHAAHYLVRAAVTAPSLHNSQPWRFVSRDGEIDMYADARRLLGVCDPGGREMLIGCGAALFNLRLAMRHLGFLPVVRLCPDPGRPGFLARVGWGAYALPTPDEERMFGALPHRHTHRGPFDAGPLSPALLNALARHAWQEGTELFFLYDAEDENRLAELIRTAETFQRDDPGFATELAAWTVSPDEGRRDGVPAQYRPWRPEDLLFAERDFPHQPPESDHRSSRRVPAPNSLGLVALLNTRQDGPQDWLRAGQALQRVLLFAAALRFTPEVLCQAADTAGASIGLIHHRKRASLGTPALRRIHATLALTRLQVEAVTRAAALRHPHRFRPIAVNDFDTPADAAETLREEWNVPVGPIEDLVALLEHAGALVVVRDLGTTELDAVSQWPRDRAPLILLNSTARGDRSRFSLAHELGHLIMHREPGEGRTQESQADRFAAEFLMPHEVILGELKPGIDIARLMDLKARWGVSMAALIRRATDLGVISEWQYRTLMVELSALGYRTNEPIVIQREAPRHVAQAVTRLEGQHHLSATETAHLAGLGREEFHEIYLCASSPSGHKDVPDPSAR